MFYGIKKKGKEKTQWKLSTVLKFRSFFIFFSQGGGTKEQNNRI